MQAKTPLAQRRSFFKSIAVMGGCLLVSLTGKAGAAPHRSKAKKPVRAGGYRLTAHIRQYYDTASR